MPRSFLLVVLGVVISVAILAGLSDGSPTRNLSPIARAERRARRIQMKEDERNGDDPRSDYQIDKRQVTCPTSIANLTLGETWTGFLYPEEDMAEDCALLTFDLPSGFSDDLDIVADFPEKQTGEWAYQIVPAEEYEGGPFDNEDFELYRGNFKIPNCAIYSSKYFIKAFGPSFQSTVNVTFTITVTPVAATPVTELAQGITEISGDLPTTGKLSEFSRIGRR